MQAHWCYPIERCLKTLRKKYRNKGKIVASIAETYILEEVSNFTEKYYVENLPSVHNPPLVTMLAKMNRTSAFSEGNSEAQVHRPKTLTHEEWRCIMLYVLNNLDEVAPYIG
jgi:hypothetical protein